MCHKCQHIQQHELKMISACNGVLLPVTSTSSIFFKRKDRRNALECCLSLVPSEEQNTNYYLPSSSLVPSLLKILRQGFCWVHLLLTSDSSNMISLLTKENTKLQRTCILIDKQ